MQRILIAVRVGGAVFLLTFLVAALAGVSDTVKAAFITIIALCFFSDAVISLAYPQLAKQSQPDTLIGSLYKSSLFYGSKATRGYTLAMAILSGVMLLAVTSKLLGYW